MVSRYIWIGIVIGVFFVGIGVSYAIFASTYDPNTMKFQNQELFDQMISQNPKMTANWMETMMQDAQFHDQVMDYMAKNPEQMNQWMVHDPKHVEEMASSAYLSNSPMENLRSLVRKVVKRCFAGHGCLDVNSLVELAPHDPEVNTMLDHGYTLRLRLVTDLIDKAQRTGEITIEQTPRRLATLLLMTLFGGAASVKGFINADDAGKAVEDLLNTWM